jgi:hypothetical protein
MIGIPPDSAWGDLTRLLRSYLALRGVPMRRRPDPLCPQAWRLLLPWLRAHRLRPLAHWVAQQSGVSLEDDLCKELESAYFSAGFRYETLRAAAAEIGLALDRQGIRAILLKGFPLAEGLYPVPACRPMEDIDLLVRPEERERASHLLVALGYTDTSFGVEDFRRPGSGLVVDLHAELLNTTRLPIRRRLWDPPLDIWWTRARPLEGCPGLWRLASDDHLVYLCHHAWLHHGLRKPLGLLDICQHFTGGIESGCLETLAGRPDAAAIRRGLWYALGACRDRFEVIFPRGLEAGFLRRRPGGIWERVVHALATRGILASSARYGYLWFGLGASERIALLRQIATAARS